MSIYNNNNITGDFWVRDFNGNIYTAFQMLSNVISKYQISQSKNFYNEVKNNNVNKFDIFYDSIFLETPSGYVFEKTILENNQLYAYNQFDYFNQKYSTNPDYWFDENEKSVYICDFIDSVQNSVSSINLNLIFNKFNINNGFTTNLLNVTATVILLSAQNIYYTHTLREDPKLTYNPDTNTFNVSFLLKNDIQQFGIISINIKKTNNFKIDHIDAYIPFAVVDIKSSYIL